MLNSFDKWYGFFFSLWQCLPINFDNRWEINIFEGSSYCNFLPNQMSFFLKTFTYRYLSNFEFCQNRRNSFWTSWATLSFLMQTKHTFCHFKQTDNCTASFSSQLKKSWIGIFLDSKLHMYASKYNVHGGQKNCQLRKIIKSMAILVLLLLLSQAIT